jgi:ABC-2 type transport system ATP-binding protein
MVDSPSEHPLPEGPEKEEESDMTAVVAEPQTTGLEHKPSPLRGTGLTAALALEVEDVTKVFVTRPSLISRMRGKTDGGKRVVAVDHVTLEVKRGEIYGLLGPNGTGKSTLIRLFSTLLAPDEGKVRVFGYDVVEREAEVKRLINRVSVEASFFKKLSPMENLMYGARLYSVDPERARREIVTILLRLGIEERSIWTPVLLLLDEPTTGLDPHSKREVQAFVREIRDKHDATVLLTTHDMQEADDLCERVAIIDRGKIVALDTPAQLKAMVREEGGPEPTLEDVFLKLTGKKLDEGEEAAP